MSRVPVCVLLIGAVMMSAVCQRTGAQALPDSSIVQFLPAQRLFPRLLADGMSHQLGISKDFHSRLWLGTVGAQRPMLQLSLGSCDLQAGIGATVHTSFLRTSPLLQVVTVDFLVDFPVDIRLSPSLTFRTGYGHYSAHLADDGIEQLGIPSVNYVKDYIMFLAAYALQEIGGFVYGGGRMDFHSLPEREKHWVTQWGCEAGNITVLPSLRLYAAVDFRFKQENAWRSTQSYQAGAKLFQQPTGMVRIAYTYRTGIDDRGQFFEQTAGFSLLGIYVDF